MGHYLVKDQEDQMGLVDKNNNFIIPLDSNVLWQWYPPESHYFIRGNRQMGDFQEQLYDVKGQLLFSNVNIGIVGLGTHLEKADNSYRDYFMVEQKGRPNKLLFHKRNGQILPDSFSSIEYGGSNSTFLALHLGEKGAPKVVSVYDLNGKKLFTVPPEIRVMHTGRPNLLLATKSNPQKQALIFIDKGLDSTGFEYDALRKMWTGWFVYSKDARKHFGLLDANGIPAGPADFTKLSEPNHNELEIFRTKRGSSPMATGFRESMEKGTWIGIDSLGVEHLFTEAAPPETFGQMQERLRSEKAKTAISKLPDGSTLEKSPSFPGGDSAMRAFLAANLKYPKIAIENGIEGTVVLQIVVEADGRLSNIAIKRDIGNGCGLAAVQCFEKMPRWLAAEQNSQAVASVLTVPVSFKLNH
ncbi:MAG: energy transducer TonB [Saprospiraceae bacterium]|nr:energy transducer TonB [Saprospiraceae bacterium]